MNNSELKTYILSSKVFFEPFTYKELYYKTENGDCELCDVLLEFQKSYVVIEIKERDKSKILDQEKWFHSKIRKKAVDQIVKDINVIKNSDKFIIHDSKNNRIKIDNNKIIYPVIIFENENISIYDHIIFSHRLGENISVFKSDDFETVINNLFIPFDILNYIDYRNSMYGKFPNLDKTRLISDNLESGTVILRGKFENETDMVEHYLLRTYEKRSLVPEVLKDYNKMLTLIFENAPQGKEKDLLFQFLSVNAEIAQKLLAHWQISCERCLKSDAFPPFFMWDDEQTLVSLISRPTIFSDQEFFNFYSHIFRLYSYKYKKREIYLILFEKDKLNGWPKIKIAYSRNDYETTTPDEIKLLNDLEAKTIVSPLKFK